jgi:1-acyl-sn-glycerol-3-phosphate acyltransferase
VKSFVYTLIKWYIRTGFYFYFKKIRLHRIADLPWGKPMLLLPNHQNALLDPLIIAVFAPRKPFFLTRADVFVNPLLNQFFSLLQMLPVYRIRDGRDTLARNSAIFERCSSLLAGGEALVMFPEANHNLQRRVRPLSKGFTRILFHSLEKYPEASIFLVPVGINYRNAAGFPDSVAYYFGHEVAGAPFYNPIDSRNSSLILKTVVSDGLKQLTTHIPENMSYQATIDRLDSMGLDYLNPEEANTVAAGKQTIAPADKGFTCSGITGRVSDILFFCANMASLLLWRAAIKPKISEPEFISTYRFLYAILLYPVLYALFFLLLREISGTGLTLVLLFAHLLFNLLYVKLR